MVYLLNMLDLSMVMLNNQMVDLVIWLFTSEHFLELCRMIDGVNFRTWWVVLSSAWRTRMCVCIYIHTLWHTYACIHTPFDFWHWKQCDDVEDVDAQVADVADVSDVDDACDIWIWPGASTTIPAIRQGRSARASWQPAVSANGIQSQPKTKGLTLW